MYYESKKNKSFRFKNRKKTVAHLRRACARRTRLDAHHASPGDHPLLPRGGRPTCTHYSL